MPFPLLPTWTAPDITAILEEFLKSQNIRLLMLDFDNTIVPYTTNIPSPRIMAWLESAKQWDLIVCVVSNSKNSRVPNFCKKYGLHCITHAKKPFSDGISQCLNQFQIPAHEAVLVGDQIYTDTLGGNCAGVRTILVEAINNHNVWLKLRHVAELPFIFAAMNRRIPNDKS